jgi:hypothetical protein
MKLISIIGSSSSYKSRVGGSNFFVLCDLYLTITGICENAENEGLSLFKDERVYEKVATTRHLLDRDFEFSYSAEKQE